MFINKNHQCDLDRHLTKSSSGGEADDESLEMGASSAALQGTGVAS